MNRNGNEDVVQKCSVEVYQYEQKKTNQNFEI